MSAPPATALCVGAYTLPTPADIAHLAQALAASTRVQMLLTGAQLPRSPRVPFTWQERAAVLRACLGADATRIAIHPVREWFDARRNAAALAQAAADAGVPAAAVVRCPCEAAAGALPPGDPQMRDLHPDLFRDEPAQALQSLRDRLAPGALPFVERWLASPQHAHLREEWQQIARERAIWAAVPYPVTLVTVDALVRAAGHVLLIRRGRHPGKGLWAIPGGFLETTEALASAAIRELLEETQLDVAADALHAHLRGVRAFDHPWRSQRNRIVVHVHFIDLPGDTLPRVQGGDDAAHAQWVPVQDLPTMDDQFLDDHALIVRHFLAPA